MTRAGEQQAVEDLLRRCVSCGLCLPHCATWAATGNEVYSPRGRLLLLADMLENPGSAANQAYAEAFDLCIGCRACETACPSGVPYSLLEHGESLAAARVSSSNIGWDFMLSRLDSLFWLGLMRRAGSLARTMLRAVGGARWRRRWQKAPLGGANLVRLLGSMPRGPGSDEDLMARLDRLVGCRSALGAGSTDPPPEQQEVAFFQGCANEGLLPDSSRRLKSLLQAAGYRVRDLEDQQCCGALAAHTARPGKAALLQRKNRLAVARPEVGALPVVVEAAGCGLQLKEYGRDLADRFVDAGVLLASGMLPPCREVPLVVVYHDPCHALHGQGIHHQPRELLARIPGLTLVEAQEADLCCGSGGAWGLTHQELSTELGRRKARNLVATGAQLVVTSNPGCLGQIADGLGLEGSGVEILSLTDLLWYACLTHVSGAAS